MFDIVEVFNSDRHSNHIRSYPTPFLLGIGELLVRGGGRVNDQGLGVPDVGEMRGEDAAVNEGDTSCVCACVCFKDKSALLCLFIHNSKTIHCRHDKDTHTHTCFHPLFLTFPSALHPKAQHGTKQAGPEVLLRSFVRLMFR